MSKPAHLMTHTLSKIQRTKFDKTSQSSFHRIYMPQVVWILENPWVEDFCKVSSQESTGAKGLCLLQNEENTESR